MTNSNQQSLKLAVVGHTNTGKTSILRTLLRDKYFGEVKNEVATTRHVERATIIDNSTGEGLVSLFDTPGLEDATGVMDWLEDNTSTRKDGIERLQIFLDQPVNNETEPLESYDFSQEKKVIRQLLSSDVAIYVIDVREPILSKYKDELNILSWSAIPVMPVFSFTKYAKDDKHSENSHLENTSADNSNAKNAHAENNNHHLQEWQQMLARQNLHISTQFDSVAFDFDDEIQLWKNLATMLGNDQRLIQLIRSRQENWHNLYEEATIIIADFLLNVASFVKVITEEQDPTPILTEMQNVVRQAERHMQQELLNLYKFYDNEVATTTLDLHEYQQNPFNGELLKRYGIRAGSGATVGALIGMGIDVATLGTSMGLGTALGGFLGGILPNSSKIVEVMSKKQRLQIDPATITLLATRALALLATLRHRGHATVEESISPFQTQCNSNNQQFTQSGEDFIPSFAPWSADKLPKELATARGKSEWSSLDGNNSEQARLLRLDMAWKLAHRLTLSIEK